VVRVVGEPDGFGLVGEGGDGQYKAEDLLSEQATAGWASVGTVR
jgi:hypothetical protein